MHHTIFVVINLPFVQHSTKKKLKKPTCVVHYTVSTVQWAATVKTVLYCTEF